MAGAVTTACQDYLDRTDTVNQVLLEPQESLELMVCPERRAWRVTAVRMALLVSVVSMDCPVRLELLEEKECEAMTVCPGWTVIGVNLVTKAFLVFPPHLQFINLIPKVHQDPPVPKAKRAIPVSPANQAEWAHQAKKVSLDFLDARLNLEFLAPLGWPE